MAHKNFYTTCGDCKHFEYTQSYDSLGICTSPLGDLEPEHGTEVLENYLSCSKFSS